MERFEGGQRIRHKNSQKLDIISKIPQRQVPWVSESFRESLWHDFFGTKQDTQKSLFVFSMLILIIGFFTLSAFNLSLSMVIGIMVVCYGLYGGIRWDEAILERYALISILSTANVEISFR